MNKMGQIRKIKAFYWLLYVLYWLIFLCNNVPLFLYDLIFEAIMPTFFFSFLIWIQAKKWLLLKFSDLYRHFWIFMAWKMLKEKTVLVKLQYIMLRQKDIFQLPEFWNYVWLKVIVLLKGSNLNEKRSIFVCQQNC